MLNNIREKVVFSLAETATQRKIKSKFNRICSDSNLEKKQRAQRKKEQLYKVLLNAKNNISYYQKLFKEQSFNPENILTDLRYLNDLPILKKETIKENPELFINKNIDKKKLYKRMTGGSTGSCLNIYYDKESLDWTAAANLFALEMTGKGFSEKEINLVPDNMKYLKTKEAILNKAKGYALNKVSIPISNTDEKHLETLWKRLKSQSPYLVHGHPSTMYQLSKYIERKKDFDFNAITAFESTGEMIDKKKLECIERNIGCKVFNRYGNAEFGVIAHSKNNPYELEVLDYLAHVESMSLGNGLEELIVTTTTNTTMPLIRYKTGDYGEVVHKDGRDFIVNLYGRVHDVVEINGKVYPTHYIQEVLERVGGVDEFQIVKTSNKNHMIIRVVSNDKSKEELVTNTLNDLFEKQAEVVFTDFNSLIRTGWRDKFRYVVNE